MQSAGATEDPLARMEDSGQAGEDGRIDCERLPGRLNVAGADGVDRGLAADAATGARNEMASEMRDIHRFAGGERHVHEVAARLAIGTAAIADASDLLAPCEDPFRQQESGCQIEIVTGGSHRHADRLAVDADLQRFLAGELVEDMAPASPVPLADLCCFGRLWRMTHRAQLIGGPMPASKVIELQLHREFVLLRQTAGADARVRALDVRVVAGPPVVQTDGPAVLVSQRGIHDISIGELQNRRQLQRGDQVPELEQIIVLLR